MKKNELFTIYGKDYTAMTMELLRRCELGSMIGRREAKIGIKPNLLGQVLASEGGTTHPEVVEGIIRYLQEEEFEDIVILESSWVGDSTRLAFEYCGYTQLADKYRVPLWDLQEDRGTALDCAGLKLNVCERALEVDFLINVPVLKGHCQTGITCALKNMKGLIPGSEKRRFHRMGLHRPIAHLSAGVHQDFILADCICPDLTFEDGGNPVELDCLIAASDPVLCDAFGCGMIGLPVSAVEYIGLAEKLGVGSADPGKARVIVIREEEENGQNVYREVQAGGADESSFGAKPVQGGFRRVMKLAENVNEVESCSACYAYLIPALEMLDADGLLPRLQEKICIGQGHRGKEGELGVGNCTSRFRHSLAGCPPTEGQIYEFLKEYINRTPDGEAEL